VTKFGCAVGALVALASVSLADPSRSDRSAAVFGDKLWRFHLTISAKDWEAMQPVGGPRFGPGPGGPPGRPPAAPPGKDERPPALPQPPRPPQGGVPGKFGFTFPYVKGALEADGRTYKEVGVRFKGNSSYMMSARGLKRPFKIDFNRHVEDQTFHGLTTINLSNNMMDPSQLREALSYAVFRAAGVPSPRTAFVELYLTVPGKHEREFIGLYTLVEQVNGTFLKDHFQTSKGMLLKPEGIRGLPYLGEDWSKYARYRPKKKPSHAAQRRLIDFTRLLNEADDAAFRRQIDSFVDVDEFLRFLAANVVLSNFDSFIGLGHNYYIYLHPKTNRFVWIPWDMNLSFGSFGMAGSPEQLTDLSIRKPCMGEHRMVERMLAIKEYDAIYRKHLRELTTTAFAPEKMHADIDAMRKVVRGTIEKEAKVRKAPPAAPPGPPRPPGPPGGPGRGMFGGQPDLKEFVTKRTASVTAQLDGKSQGQVLRNRGFGPGGFGPGMFLAEPMLKIADTDKDGKLSLDEFSAGLKRLFDECDKDKTGALDEKTLAGGVSRLLPRPPGFGGFPPPPRPGGFDPGAVWAGVIVKRADADKSGKVTRDELLTAGRQLFKEWDKDKSGTLDRQEITEGLNRLAPPPPGFGPPPPRPPDRPPASPADQRRENRN
jgi:Ca2+-binding EF-hand superfamily protein